MMRLVSRGGLLTALLFHGRAMRIEVKEALEYSIEEDGTVRDYMNSTECDLSRYDFGDRFSNIVYAGAGANGCVVLANDASNSGDKVAIKISKKPGRLRTWKKECADTKAFHKRACKAEGLQMELSERFLPNCLEVGGDDQAPFIVMHAAGGEGLGDKNKLLGNLASEEERLSVFAQIVGALTSLHGIGMCHNDLHDNNVVWLSKQVPVTICLIDFGETVPFAKGHYSKNKPSAYKQDENLIMKRALQLTECPDGDDRDKDASLECIRKKWESKGADDEFFTVLGQVYDEAAEGKHPEHVPKLFQTKFIQQYVGELTRNFRNTECEAGAGDIEEDEPTEEAPKDPACKANYGCKDLAGNCCPHADGTFLACCDVPAPAEWAAAPTPVPITPQPTATPPTPRPTPASTTEKPAKSFATRFGSTASIALVFGVLWIM